MDKIRILIVSVSATGRHGLASIFLSNDSFEVLDEVSYEEVLDCAVQRQPDVILCDRPTSDEELNKMREMKRCCPCTRVITLTGPLSEDDTVMMLNSEADGFVPRNIMPQLLSKIVELACRAGIYCLPSSVRDYICNMNGNGNANDCESKHERQAGVVLTKRELEILDLMSKNNSNKAIARKLYISEPTVKTHVSSILRKLGQPNRTQAIVYCYRNGILSSAQD